MHDLDLRDHSVLKISCSHRDPILTEQRLISWHIVADRPYAEYLQKLVDVSNLDALAVPLRLR